MFGLILIAIAWALMQPFGWMGEARNAMLKVAEEKIGGIGALEPVAPTVVTWTAAAGKVLKSNIAHNLTSGQLVVLLTLGGGTGLLVEREYYAHEVSATEIELSQTSANVGEEWTTSVTSATFNKLNEIAETRAAYVFAAPSKGVIEKATAATIAATGACSYEYIGFWTATSAGTLYHVVKVTKETLASAGSIEVKRSTLDLTAVA